jgi:hypothetical protein
MIYIEENSFERQIDLISALASQAPFDLVAWLYPASTIDKHIPNGGVVSGAPGRARLFLGGQLNPDGTLCAYGGLMGGIPGPNYSTGPIEYKQ